MTTFGEMVVPTAEGITDGIEAIKANMEAGKWTMIAPDGRVWMTPEPMILFAALAAIMRGEELRFGEH
ncbi:MAG: hypothetical protein JWN23_1132 [Rhodocyclales bacterium]|nr:hypothetical protein [Rhodocyclales bacterium]